MARESIIIDSTITLSRQSSRISLQIAIDCIYCILYAIDNQIEKAAITWQPIGIQTNTNIIHEDIAIIFMFNESYLLNFFNSIIICQLELNMDIIQQNKINIGMFFNFFIFSI